MATGNSVHDEVKEQQQKLKGKPFKEKWAYFWEYYKIQTIVVIAVLAFAGNLIYTFATRKDTVMEAAFVNCYMNTEVDSDTMIADFEQYADIDTSSDCAAINRDMYVDYENSDQYSYANVQKIIAMISGKTLDALITDDTYMDHNLEAGLFCDLHQYFTDEELAQYGDQVIYKDLPDDNTDGEIPIGISVSRSKYLLTDQTNAWFTIPANCQHPENAKKFLEFMLEP